MPDEARAPARRTHTAVVAVARHLPLPAPTARHLRRRTCDRNAIRRCAVGTSTAPLRIAIGPSMCGTQPSTTTAGRSAGSRPTAAVVDEAPTATDTAARQMSYRATRVGPTLGNKARGGGEGTYSTTACTCTRAGRRVKCAEQTPSHLAPEVCPPSSGASGELLNGAHEEARPQPPQRVHAGDRTKTGTPPSWAVDEGALGDGGNDAGDFSSPPSQSDFWCPPTAAQVLGQSPTADATAARPVSRRPWPAGGSRPASARAAASPVWEGAAEAQPARANCGRSGRARAGPRGAGWRGRVRCDEAPCRPPQATTQLQQVLARPHSSPFFATGVSPGPRPAARGGPSGVSPPPLVSPAAQGRLSSPDRQPPLPPGGSLGLPTSTNEVPPMHSHPRPPMRFHHILPAPMKPVWTEVGATQTAHWANTSGPAASKGHLIATLSVEGTDGHPASDTGPALGGLLSERGSFSCLFKVRRGWSSSRTPPLRDLIGAATTNCESQLSPCLAPRSEGARGGFARVCAPPRRGGFGRRTGALVADVAVKPPLPSTDGVPVDEWPTATEIQIQQAWCQITWLQLNLLCQQIRRWSFHVALATLVRWFIFSVIMTVVLCRNCTCHASNSNQSDRAQRYLDHPCTRVNHQSLPSSSVLSLFVSSAAARHGQQSTPTLARSSPEPFEHRHRVYAFAVCLLPRQRPPTYSSWKGQSKWCRRPAGRAEVLATRRGDCPSCGGSGQCVSAAGQPGPFRCHSHRWPAVVRYAPACPRLTELPTRRD